MFEQENVRLDPQAAKKCVNCGVPDRHIRINGVAYCGSCHKPLNEKSTKISPFFEKKPITKQLDSLTFLPLEGT